jgi:Cu-processing system ATP-binding protein
MRQKLNAALAFLFNPDVLILDEPTAGLDPVSSEELKEKIILEKTNNKLVIITSHILSDLDEMIETVVYMEEGQVRFNKSLQTLKEETGEVRLQKAIAAVIRQQQNTAFT